MSDGFCGEDCMSCNCREPEHPYAEVLAQEKLRENDLLRESNQRLLEANNAFESENRKLKRLARSVVRFAEAHRAFESALEEGRPPTDAETENAAVSECEMVKLIEEFSKGDSL